MSHIETDMDIAAKQAKVASQLYDGTKVGAAAIGTAALYVISKKHKKGDDNQLWTDKVNQSRADRADPNQQQQSASL